MCFTLFSDVTCFASWEWTWGGTRILYLRGCCVCYVHLDVLITFWVYLGVRTCELFLCFVVIVRVRVYYADFFVFFVLRHWWVSQVLIHRGRAKVLPCPHENEQEQRLPSVSIKFLRLRQIHDSSGISPALDNALSTLLSCCSQHFSPVRVLASFIHLPVVTLSDNDSKMNRNNVCPR